MSDEMFDLITGGMVPDWATDAMARRTVTPMTTNPPESHSDAAEDHVPGVGNMVGAAELSARLRRWAAEIVAAGEGAMEFTPSAMVQIAEALEAGAAAYEAGARDMRDRAAVECNEMRLSLYLLGRDASAQVAEKLVDMIDALPLTKDDR